MLMAGRQRCRKTGNEKYLVVVVWKLLRLEEEVCLQECAPTSTHLQHHQQTVSDLMGACHMA